MADTTYVNGVTLTDADWFNDVNRLHYTIFLDPSTLSSAKTSLAMGGVGRSQNAALAASVGASALTINLQSKALATASATDPIRIPYRNATVGTGDYAELDVTASSSLVISSGSTMGARNGIPFRLWIVSFNDAGTQRIGAINCVTSAANITSGSDVTSIFGLAAWGIASAVSEGGVGAADSAQVFYANAAVTSKAYTVLGYMTWETGLTTAGTWDAVPTRIQMFGPGVSLPGQPVQKQGQVLGTSTTGTTAVPHDNTVPTSGEGDQYMTVTITPSSAANVLNNKITGHFGQSNASSWLAMSLYQDATNSLATAIELNATANGSIELVLEHDTLAGTSASTTMKMRAGGDTGATTTFNGQAGVQHYGGACASRMYVTELMG